MNIKKIIGLLLLSALVITINIFAYHFDPKLLAVSITISLLFGLLFFVQQKLKKDGEYQKNLILFAGFCATIIGFFVNGYFSSKNEENKNIYTIEQSVLQSKRLLKTRFLFDAYVRLSNADWRDTVPPGHIPNKYDGVYLKYLESALTAVQLLANERTVLLANDYVKNHGSTQHLALLIALRNELRQELNLLQLPPDSIFNPTVLRTYKKQETPDSLTNEQQLELVMKLSEYHKDFLK